MGVIHEFPKKHRVNHRRVYKEVKPPNEVVYPHGDEYTDEPKRNVWRWFGFGLRMVTFFVLYWLRFPVVLVCNLIAAPAFIAWLFALAAFPEGAQYTHAKWGFAIISFTAFMLKYGYDYLLGLLSPEEVIRTL